MRKIGIVAAAAVLVLLCSLWRFVRPDVGGYAVRGVDVSHYQGEIDFDVLAGQGMSFAFIKATEGSSWVDECLERNAASVQASPLRPGFYHFFSYDSPGRTQAENFIANVPALEGMLPPVIDVEFYGGYYKDPAGKKQVTTELRDMVQALEEHYGMKPVIYCTGKAYRLYIREMFDDCDLWIRSVYTRPLPGMDWTFWQYTDNAKLEGYAGEEPCIDVNVFYGTEEEFLKYPF